MVKAIVVALLMLVGWGFYQNALAPVYVTFSNEHQDPTSVEKTLYFWASDKDRDFFQVGKTYELIADKQKKQLSLFSVTYAAIKPDALKLGFRLTQSEAFIPSDGEFKVILLP